MDWVLAAFVAITLSFDAIGQKDSSGDQRKPLERQPGSLQPALERRSRG